MGTTCISTYVWGGFGWFKYDDEIWIRIENGKWDKYENSDSSQHFVQITKQNNKNGTNRKILLNYNGWQKKNKEKIKKEEEYKFYIYDLLSK